MNIFQAPSPSVKKRKVSLIFDHMEPDEMAEHLSYLEFKNFCNVSVSSVNNFLLFLFCLMRPRHVAMTCRDVAAPETNTHNRSKQTMK